MIEQNSSYNSLSLPVISMPPYDLLTSIWHVTGLHKSSKNLGVTLKFKVPEG